MAGARDNNYQIGYRKPPTNTRFAKGRSGNPKGRPRGSKNFATLLRQALAERVVVNENGRRKKVTKLQAIVKQLVNRALQAEYRSIQLLVAHDLGGADLQALPEPRLPATFPDLLGDAIGIILEHGAMPPQYEALLVSRLSRRATCMINPVEGAVVLDHEHEMVGTKGTVKD
jgi:hypothetical protein